MPDMTQEEFDREYPHGSQKRQEFVWAQEAKDAEQGVTSVDPEPAPPVPPAPEPTEVDSGIPEELWRGNG